MFPWKRTSLMLNLVLNSLEPKYDVRSDFRLLENDQLPRPWPEDFAMRSLIYTEDYYPHGWFDNGNIEGRERYFELGSMTRERKHRLITLGYRIAASGRWLIWNKETRSFTVPKNYDTAIEDPPEPTRDVSKTTSDSPQSKTLHPGRQYWLKLMCEAQDGPKPNLERKRHSKIHEAIEELSRFWESLDGSRKLDDSGSSCVFGCTYMAMGIQLELKGESDLAASYEAEAKAYFEKALRNNSKYAVRVSMTGIATNGNVEEETWSQLEQWLRNYSLCFVAPEHHQQPAIDRTADLDTVADMNSTGDTAVSLAPPSEESFLCDLTEQNALECDRGSDFSYTDSASTYGLGEDWILFPDFMGLGEHDENLMGIGPHPCDVVHALSLSGASDKWMQNIEKHVQRSLVERRSETRNGKIKRPLNAFMLYRMAFRHVAEQLYATKDQKRVSKICGESWLQEAKELRAWFRLQALTEKENCTQA
ncbi:hypothetical protein CEP51_016759 [Fusarium floridanum]|uniref:HMG box domain-containing protein n=1 Tax=Fusarium floridanum TaxID=1325733 RepID=A0A428NGG4_9HYPO|nr:hypothetical protein CEP51_016759 [Fusarium floridanum]